MPALGQILCRIQTMLRRVTASHVAAPLRYEQSHAVLSESAAWHFELISESLESNFRRYIRERPDLERDDLSGKGV